MNKKDGRLYRKYGEMIEERRSILLGVFKNLRKAGLIARANFLCCTGCASSALFHLYDEMPDEKKSKVRGCAYWHSQNEDDIWERGKVNIGYGALGDDSDEADVSIGREIFSALESAGLDPVWSGDANQKILVPLLPLDVFGP